MFSLIISIIAIALVVVLAGASLYYGGDAFNKGTSKGEAAKIVNEAQQLQAAFTMYKVDKKGATLAAGIADATSTTGTALLDELGYLAADLSAWDIDTVEGQASQTIGEGDVCDEVQKLNSEGTNTQVSCTNGDVVYVF